MQNPRELYYGALFNRLKTLEGAGVTTVSRRLKHWNDVPPEAQPYIGVAQVRERGSYNPGRTEAWYLDLVLYVYVTEPDTDNGAPSILLNQVMDLINGALQPDNTNTNACTLGGLFHYVRIAETGTDTDEGTLGAQAVARIPVEMLVVG